MTADIVAEGNIIVGRPIVVEGPSPRADFGVVFEDDDTTGYLYGLDFSREENPIVDAMHIDMARQNARATPIHARHI
jgi:hypothetical protein